MIGMEMRGGACASATAFGSSSSVPPVVLLVADGQNAKSGRNAKSTTMPTARSSFDVSPQESQVPSRRRRFQTGPDMARDLTPAVVRPGTRRRRAAAATAAMPAPARNAVPDPNALPDQPKPALAGSAAKPDHPVQPAERAAAALVRDEVGDERPLRSLGQRVVERVDRRRGRRRGRAGDEREARRSRRRRGSRREGAARAGRSGPRGRRPTSRRRPSRRSRTPRGRGPTRRRSRSPAR